MLLCLQIISPCKGLEAELEGPGTCHYFGRVKVPNGRRKRSTVNTRVAGFLAGADAHGEDDAQGCFIRSMTDKLPDEEPTIGTGQRPDRCSSCRSLGHGNPSAPNLFCM